MFGPDFVKKLYIGSEADDLARRDGKRCSVSPQGTYPMLVGPDTTAVDQFKQLGYPIELRFPDRRAERALRRLGTDLADEQSAPSERRQTVRQLARRPGRPQAAFAKAVATASLRTDVSYGDVPAWVFPQKGGKYMDTYDYNFVTEQREAAVGQSPRAAGRIAKITAALRQAEGDGGRRVSEGALTRAFC